MYRYENNAFRVLGITPSASMKDIMQRVNEVKVKESLGMQATYDYDFAWMGPVDRSAQGAISALQRLENPNSSLSVVTLEEILSGNEKRYFFTKPQSIEQGIEPC